MFFLKQSKIRLMYMNSLEFRKEQASSNNTADNNSAISYITSFFGRLIKLGAQCSVEEKERANEVKQIHDLIEEVAYRAFAQKVTELNITQDRITEEESGKILSYIKAQAHKEMYKKEDGYIVARARLLNYSQVERVIQSVGKIVHDRDTKLTDARYYSLSELLMGLDDHNTMVKEILLQSWYKCSSFSDPDHEHLDQIKDQVDFYQTLDKQLEFNLKEALKAQKAFWNQFFPGKREADKSASQEFVNIQELRHLCEVLHVIEPDAKNSFIRFVTQHKKYVLTGPNLNDKLADYLDHEDAILFFEPRNIRNQVRGRVVETEPLLKDRNITVKQFFSSYFPEKDFSVDLDYSRKA